MSKRSIKISLIKFLALIIVVTPFIFIEPQGALASIYDSSLTESWVTPMSGSPLQINNLQVVENDRGSFADHVKISWQTNPNSPGSIGYLVTIWTSDDLGVTWTTYHLRHSDNPTENPHFFGATVGGCYSVIGKWIVDDFEPVPEAAFMNMYNGSCQGILFSQRTTMDYATIDTQNTITYSHFKFKQGSALVKNNFILQFKIETFYDGGWSLKAPGPIINARLTAGAQIGENQRIDEVQRYYNNVLTASTNMFGSGKIVKGTNWTDSRNVAEWVQVQFANWATAKMKEVLLGAGGPQGIIGALVNDNETLFPTDAGWNVIGSIKSQSATTLSTLNKLKTIKGSNDVLSKEFIIKDVTTGAEKKRTTSLQEVETELKAQLDAIASTVGSTTDPGATGLCMKSITGNDINILRYISCLIDEVAKGILTLAIEWMQIFANI
ncbi:MAG: hypothetical protein UT11_C0006G0009 [Berkelbacteria bacterium GW2011_GWA2_38_9]|uniref:Uncharacterized protein n=1 Tax=Berkelbacteria bacterium GW2011_GWA2_38_9 TaxID=1618334 RepID=A0A0G0LR20_9BACT|nr:MAG: hypothetical protein UT11_C0006G0009 [Berkelbacteria bacterium GW2011_GWA2_38_9]